MAERSTYIKLDRNILNWGWHDNPNTFTVFVHLLAKANIADHEFHGVTIHRGQVAISTEHLAEMCGISFQQVRTALKNLKSTGEITSKGYNKFTVITIENYCFYQDSTSNETSNQQANNKQITSRQQADNNNQRRKEHIKELKNKRNVFLDYAGENEHLLNALHDFELMRKAMKKPMTDRSKERLITELEKCGGDPVAVLERSIAHNWLSVYPIRTNEPTIAENRSEDTVDPMIKAMLEKRRRERKADEDEDTPF